MRMLILKPRMILRNGRFLQSERNDISGACWVFSCSLAERLFTLTRLIAQKSCTYACTYLKSGVIDSLC